MRQENAGGIPVNSDPAGTGLPTLKIDWEFYEEFLKESDLPDEQKSEIVETLFSVVAAFVDLAYGIHPLQSTCGQNRELAEFIATEAAELIQSTSSLTTDDRNGAGSDSAACVTEEFDNEE